MVDSDAAALETSPTTPTQGTCSANLVAEGVRSAGAVLVVTGAEGAALLLVEQYVNRAPALADYGYLLERGEPASPGEPAEVGEERLHEQCVGQVPGPASRSLLAPSALRTAVRPLPLASAPGTGGVVVLGS